MSQEQEWYWLEVVCAAEGTLWKAKGWSTGSFTTEDKCILLQEHKGLESKGMLEKIKPDVWKSYKFSKEKPI